uniref:G-protein coupled receptors family 1 profile domain-containing protein n=1 Tax=Pyxicephalus adspersus TaxID=30357 RepID=A0AAV2ZZS5_PYXAD|nr:TPA: hypothetical protein GDO54_015010 [Pyxicephalus adspersus]
MDNSTSIQFFYLVTFSKNSTSDIFFLCAFFLIYFVGIIGNSAMIALICLDSQLHTPMYLFICNLSVIDILYTNAMVPKLLHMLLTRNNKISFTQCFTQVFAFTFIAGTEDVLLAAMAYDRYVAICKPLHHQRILCKRNCVLLTSGLWLYTCLNAILMAYSASTMTFCHSVQVQQFFCDVKGLNNLFCTSSKAFYIALNVETMLFGVIPLLCCLLSYSKIITEIMRIKTKDGRRKAFSTCSSHLTIITLYFVTAVAMYLMSPKGCGDVLYQVFSVFCTTITPMLNPLIYSLQNKDVRRAMKRFLGAK